MTSGIALRRFSTSDANVHRPIIRLQRQSSCHHHVRTPSSGDSDSSPTSPPSSSRSSFKGLFRRLRSQSSSTSRGGHSDSEATNETRSHAAVRKTKSDGQEQTVRNIYRRPSRRTKHKPQVSTMGELRRKQFAGVGDEWGTHEEHESDENGKGENEEAASKSDAHPASTQGRGSILRRPRSKSVPSVPQSRKTERTRENSVSPRTVSQKQTSFCENVEVIYYDENATPVSNLLSQNEKLKNNEEINNGYHCCDINKNCLEGLHGPVMKHSRNESDVLGDDYSVITNPKKSWQQKSTETEAESTLISCSLSGVVFHPKSGGGPQRGIRLRIEIDNLCMRNRTKVKVLSGGTSVLVMTYKSESGLGNDRIQENIERINLPVTIDPYSVKAQVKTNGMLLIEAPLRSWTLHDWILRSKSSY